MAALVLDTDYFVKEASPNNNIVQAMVIGVATIDGSDTIAVTLANIGISPKGFIGAYGWKHTTDNSVSVTEFPTTAVVAGVLTLTFPAVTNNDPRYVLIIGTSGVNP